MDHAIPSMPRTPSPPEIPRILQLTANWKRSLTAVYLLTERDGAEYELQRGDLAALYMKIQEAEDAMRLAYGYPSSAPTPEWVTFFLPSATSAL